MRQTMAATMVESKQRSLIKGLSYRLMASLATFAVTLTFTGNPAISFQVGIADFVVKLFIFYGNDRLWQHIRWGRLTSAPSVSRNKIRPITHSKKKWYRLW